MALPIVAVVGRPNVGKSTFVNRIAEADEAIVHEMRGVTRDRSYHKADWNGIEFKLIDTGGIEMGTEDQFQGLHPLAGVRGDPTRPTRPSSSWTARPASMPTTRKCAHPAQDLRRCAACSQQSSTPQQAAMSCGNSISQAWATCSPSPPRTVMARAICSTK